MIGIVLTVVGIASLLLSIVGMIVIPKKCPYCNGVGELPPNGMEDSHTECPICQGRGVLI